MNVTTRSGWEPISDHALSCTMMVLGEDQAEAENH